MDQSLKERLVGAAVLVGLAVWLTPWVLDGPVPDAEFETVQLPPSEGEAPFRTQTIRLDQGQVAAARTGTVSVADAVPSPGSMSTANTDLEPASASPVELPATPVPEPKIPATSSVAPPGVSASVSAMTTEDVPAEVSATPSVTESAVVRPEATAPGWVVQLGSFRDEENARRLADRVKALGYKANLSTYTVGAGLMYRVRVGPEPNRESAADIASALTAQGVFPAQVVSSN